MIQYWIVRFVVWSWSQSKFSTLTWCPHSVFALVRVSVRVRVWSLCVRVLFRDLLEFPWSREVFCPCPLVFVICWWFVSEFSRFSLSSIIPQTQNSASNRVFCSNFCCLFHYRWRDSFVLFFTFHKPFCFGVVLQSSLFCFGPNPNRFSNRIFANISIYAIAAAAVCSLWISGCLYLFRGFFGDFLSRSWCFRVFFFVGVALKIFVLAFKMSVFWGSLEVSSQVSTPQCFLVCLPLSFRSIECVLPQFPCLEV